MPIIRAQVGIPYDTGLPGDVATNVFHFNTGATLNAADLDAIDAILTTFYTGDTGPGLNDLTVGQFLSSKLGPTANITMYNLDDPEPRVPVREGSFAMLAPAVVNNDLPFEVSVCLTYTASPEEGFTKGRFRGRLYIGPLNTTATDATVPRPSLGLRTTLTKAASKLLQEAFTNGVDWVVRSAGARDVNPVTGYRTTAIRNGVLVEGGELLAEDNNAVIGGWVDDEWDTQRRRGLGAGARMLWDDTTFVP